MMGEVVNTGGRCPFLQLWPDDTEWWDRETGAALAVALEDSGVATADEVRHMSSSPASAPDHLHLCHFSETLAI